ncbi:M24 family metallopeptidase [Lapidilactobacillus bayanensis]|uniref:M24 family metallopeptidase n=1 Tax=Lapidilactobacillus bayanensis TaxID=2485998 RepID=UPI000F79DDA8|nr:Xaa-Pro peptidase family protein [Lapidilactobacillus bayanensis]
MTRLANLRTKIAQEKIPAILITDTRNVTYLSGFTGDESVLLVNADQAYFITDSRYTEQAAQQVQDFEIVEHHKGVFVEAQKLAAAVGMQTVGFEATHLNYAEFQSLTKLFGSIQLVATNGVVEQLREVKDAGEIKLLKQAIKITDDCFDFLLGFVKPGMTELAVATEMEYFMRKHGASGSSFTTIVASGYRSAWPHGTASDKKIQTGELVTFDFGCYYHGYTSDMTRTIAVGDPGAEAKKIYQIVLDANKRVVEASKPGATGGLINDVAHNYVKSQGYSFGHGTGHGIGLDIHEGPGAWGIYNAQPLVAGNVVTDEPGIYVENLGGVRIEDDLLITADGCEVLTHAPEDELIIL